MHVGWVFGWQFDGLKRKGLLQDVNWTSGRINVHDLYMEFAKLESRGKFDDSEDLEHRRCMNISRQNLGELKRSPSGRCWQRLSRVMIRDSYEDHRLKVGIKSLRGIDGRFSNVVVLKLERLSCVSGSLNLKGLKCLGSLSLIDVSFLKKIEGLGGLRNLTYLKWVKPGWSGRSVDVEEYGTIIGQLPASLEVVEIQVPLLLHPDVLAECSNLLKVKLYDIQSMQLDLSGCSYLRDLIVSSCNKLQTLDLSTCSSLESVTLNSNMSLQSLMLPHNSSVACGLKSFEVHWCSRLTDLSISDELLSVERLVLQITSVEQLADLRKCTKLQELELQLENKLYLELERQGGAEGARCFFPCQLRKLKFWCASNKAPSLSGCTRLEALELNLKFEDENGMSTNLKCLENLPSLRSLRLMDCRVTSGWPDLSRSKKLETIYFETCEIELHENDIRMLTSLPLAPLIASDGLKLDLVRRKVRTRNELKYIWKLWKLDDPFSGCWEESDLATPPIKINRWNQLV